MQIRYILNNIWCYFMAHHKFRSKDEMDTKYWIQRILLKKYLKSINKSN